MIDGHCHIAAEEFDEDRSAILQEAKKGGVNGIVGVSEFPGDFEKLLQVSREHSGLVYACIGVHPVQWGNKSVTLEDFSVAEHFIEQHHEEIVGIGEIGLDFTPRYINSPEDKEVQREVFRRQVQLAKRYGLPVNCHSRSAGRPVVDLLIEEGAEKVLLHAFDGRPSVAMRGVQAGFYFSVPPSILRSEQKQKLVKHIPLMNLLLETDAPALGPEKQVRNVPSNISISCQEIARIKNISAEEVIKQTSYNARRLFSRIPP